MNRGTYVSSFVLAAVPVALFIAHCASEEPTQIIVEVNSTPNECKFIQNTIVRVGSLDEFGAWVGEKPGCDVAKNRVGDFVLVPKSSALDGEVKLQVVSGIAKDPGSCRPDERVDCIFAKRILHFVPHQTVRVSVLMAGACRGKTCDETETCNENGECVPAESRPAPVVDSAIEPPKPDAPPTPRELCDRSGCPTLDGARCLDSGVCEVVCGLGQACNATCPPGMSCTFKCEKENSCDSVSCDATNPTCELVCLGRSACNKVVCRSDSCKLLCDRQQTSSNRACEVIEIGSRNNTTIDCASSSCGDVTCAGPGTCECPNSSPDRCTDGSTTACGAGCSGGEGND